MGIIQNVLDTLKSIPICLSIMFASLIYKWFGNHRIEDEESVTGKVIVITGANRGIGEALAYEFAHRGATVVMACRDLKSANLVMEEIKKKSGNENVVLMYLDLADMASVRSFCNEVKSNFNEVKILINNAAHSDASLSGIRKKTKDGFQVHVAVNHLGHFLLTNLLLENLKKGYPSRIISVSSVMQLLSRLDLDDLMMDKADLGLAYGLPYENCKFMNGLFVKELAKRMEGSGVTAYSVCPGLVYTGIYDNAVGCYLYIFKSMMLVAGFTPEKATQGILHCALSKSIKQESGKMYRFKKHFQWANRRLDSRLAEKLWEISAKLVHLDDHSHSA